MTEFVPSVLKPVEDLGPQGRAKRAQILKAARELFLAHGYERTSMEALRLQAGVSKPTLYNHYPNKDGLFADVLAEVVADIGGDWLPPIELGAISVLDAAALHKALTTIAQRTVTELMRPEYMAVVRIVVAETPRFPQLGAMYRAVAPERGFRAIGALLERAQAAGVVSIPDGEVAARLFLGPLISYVLTDGLIVAGAPQPPPAERIDMLVSLFMKAIT